MMMHSSHITACYSRLDTDMLLTLKRFGPKSDIVKTARIIHSAQRTCAHCVSFPTLAVFVGLHLSQVDRRPLPRQASRVLTRFSTVSLSGLSRRISRWGLPFSLACLSLSLFSPGDVIALSLLSPGDVIACFSPCLLLSTITHPL